MFFEFCHNPNKRRVYDEVPGSKSVAGRLTESIGTWESLTISECYKSELKRRDSNFVRQSD